MASQRSVRPQQSAKSASALVRYAVVGLGYIAQTAVLPAFAHARKNSRLQALISGDPVKLKKLGARYGVDVVGDYSQFESCLTDVDAVYICTPNSRHEEFVVRAAQLGKHVLCEKPLAVTDAECDRMIDACDSTGVQLMTAYRLHFDPITLDVIKRVRDGAIGDLRYFSSSFSMRAKPGGIRTKHATGGGTLYDLGIYCINAARMLFGSEPEQVFAYSIAGVRSGMPEVDDTSSVVMKFSGDRLATFTSSFDAGDVSSYRIAGTKGSILVEPAYEYAEPLAYTLTVGEHTQKKRGSKVDQFAAELLYFSDCVKTGRKPEPSGEEGAWDVRIIDALYESARTGMPIALRHFADDPAPSSAQKYAQPPVASAPPLVHAKSPHS
jgi:glucose-fructose oxidoreductase